MNRPLLALRMAVAFGRIVHDPNRLDVVFDLIDALSDDPANAAEVARLLADPAIGEAARRRVRVPALALEGLESHPEGSLAEVAARFFRTHGLDPGALPRREADNDIDWLSAHLYETHDLWHVVTGFGPDVASELGLQAFYAAQVEGRVALAILCAGLLNTLLFHPDETKPRMAAIARGWQMGVRAETLVGLDWATLLPLPLDEVRRRLRIEVEARHDAMETLTPRPIAA